MRIHLIYFKVLYFSETGLSKAFNHSILISCIRSVSDKMSIKLPTAICIPKECYL